MERNILKERLIICIAITFFCTIANAQKRTITEARSIANSYLQKALVKSNRRLAAGEQMKTISSSSIISSNALEGEAFYVFSYPQSKSFVMVAGDERMGGVLAYSETNEFDFSKMSPSAKQMLESYVNYAASLNNNNIIRYKSMPSRVNGEIMTITPLIKTTWDQRQPFNDLCPIINGRHAVTGCVATGMSQLMNYYKYPLMGRDSVSYVTRTHGIEINLNLDSLVFDWDNMLDSYRYGYSQEEGNAVAQLMSACGATVEMNYGLGESGSVIEDSPNALIKYFQYDRDIVTIINDNISQSQWDFLVQKELEEGRPVFVGGQNNRNEGHAYIIDGMMPNDENEPLYHFNFGWSGLDDNYYKVIETEYHNSMSTVIGIKPENDSTDFQCFLQAKGFKMDVTKINPAKNPYTTLVVDRIMNSMQGNFIGALNVYLVDEAGNEIKIGTSQISMQPKYIYTPDIKITIPKDTELGTYSIVVKAVRSIPDAEENIVYINGEWPSLIVTDENVEFTPDIMITGMEYKKSECRGMTIAVNIANILNYGNTPFVGSFALALTDDRNEFVYVFDEDEYQQKQTINHFQSFSPLTLKGTVPEDLENGHYRLWVAARQATFDNWGLVKGWTLNGGYILNPGTDRYLDIEKVDSTTLSFDSYISENYYANVQTINMTIDTIASAGRHIKMSITQIYNLGTEVFSGALSMAIADETDKVIYTFGNQYTISAIGYLNGKGNTYTFEGDIPDSIADGQYRLCVAVQQYGFKNWTIIHKMEIANGYITKDNIDCYQDIWAKNGEVQFEPFPEIIHEDVNLDGIVDTQDVLTIYTFMQTSDGTEQYPIEDVNQDGNVDTQDILTIYDYMQTK